MAVSRSRLVLLLAFVACAIATLAQETDPEIRIDNATAPTYTFGEITIHQVTVANASHGFSPNSITATPGDIISFSFWPGNHSVIHSKFGYPCIPYEDFHSGQGGFYSGPMNDATAEYHPTWNLTVNSTDPIFFYCGAPGSCVGHAMLGAINPVAETPVLTQMKLAKEANKQLLPGEALESAVLSSMASLASSATTVTVTAARTNVPAATTSAAAAPVAAVAQHSGLGAGAIAGIAIGGVLVLVLAAGLFYFFGRSKTLKEQVDATHQREDGWAAQSRHTSVQPPSYAPAWIGGPGNRGYKGTSEVGGTEVGTPSITMGSPEMRQSGLAGERTFRFSEMSMSDQGLGIAHSPSPPPPHQQPHELDARTARSPY